MSLYWQDNADQIALANGSYLTFPDGDWTLMGWINMNNGNPGTVSYFVFSTSLWLGSPSFNIAIVGESHATIPNVMFAGIEDSSGNNIQVFQQSGDDLAGLIDGWFHIAYVRDGDTMRQFIRGVEENSGTNASLGATTTSNGADIGNYNWVNTPFRGRMGEMAFFNNRRLSDEEIVAASKGYSPLFFGTPTWYLPMWRTAQELIVPISTTPTGLEHHDDHPPMIYPPAPRQFAHVEAAVGGDALGAQVYPWQPVQEIRAGGFL